MLVVAKVKAFLSIDRSPDNPINCFIVVYASFNRGRSGAGFIGSCPGMNPFQSTGNLSSGNFPRPRESVLWSSPPGRDGWNGLEIAPIG
jgi:hypothetical protein